MNKCNFIKADNVKCNAHAIKGYKYCFFHSDEHKSQRSEAVAKGGKTVKKNLGHTEIIKIRNSGDVQVLLEDTVNDLRQGKISNKTAHTISYLAGNAMKAFEQYKKEKDAEKVDRLTGWNNK